MGDAGAVEVATSEDNPDARCLPPLYSGSGSVTGDEEAISGPVHWYSETDLFSSLTDMSGLSRAIQTFHAFRLSYLDLEEDLSQIAALGIQRVRVPISWCLTDYDPIHEPILKQPMRQITPDQIKLLYERYTCTDPFYEQEGEYVIWPAVPRSLIVSFLEACNRHGIKAVLDIHTYPGGTSPGTFSGVWPRPPLFWKYDNPEDPDRDFGRLLFQSFIIWIESLSETNPDALDGLGGITPMNEPAHLAGIFGPGSWNPLKQSFLPPLSEVMAQQYLLELQRSEFKSDKIVTVPNGAHLRVFKWQGDAIHMFRMSSLPGRGIELVINIHESVLVPSLVPDDIHTETFGGHPQATAIVAAWWRGATTPEERKTWAIMDMHHYHAWESSCQGTVDGMDGSYVCGDLAGTQDVLEQCTQFADVYRTVFDEQLGGSTEAKLVSGEFSSSTHHSVLRSCLDISTLKQSYLGQVQAASRSNVQLYYWSWKMPYGGAFRAAWSFRHLLFLLGKHGFTKPDESLLQCGGE